MPRKSKKSHHKKSLTIKQRQFAEAYVLDVNGNATEAARGASIPTRPLNFAVSSILTAANSRTLRTRTRRGGP
jgi:hypothetical protein